MKTPFKNPFSSLIAISLAAAGISAQAGTLTWTGLGETNNWSNPANWDGFIPESGDTLVFSGATPTTANNDTAADNSYLIQFATGVANFTLTGNRIALGSNQIALAGLNGGSHTFDFDMILGNPSTETPPQSSFRPNSGQTYTFNGVLSGSAVQIIGGGRAVLTNNSNSFASQCRVIQNSTLAFTSVANAGTNSALGAGDRISLGGGDSNGTIDFIGTTDSSTDRIVSLDANTNAGSRHIIAANGLEGAKLVFTAPDFNAQKAGTAALNLALGGTSSANNEIQGVIRNAQDAGTTRIDKTDAGTWILSGDNTHTGGAKLLGGTTVAAHANAFGPGSVEFNNTAAPPRLQSNGTARSLANAITQSTTVTLGGFGTGDLTFTGIWAGGGATKSITVDAIQVDLAGNLTKTGTWNKNGSGTLLVSGIAAGFNATLSHLEGSVLINGTLGTGTSGKVTVASGASLGGGGTITGLVTVSAGGFIAPGGSTGTLTVGSDVVLGGTLAIELDGTNADALDVTGDLNISDATLDLKTLSGGTTATEYVIARFGSLTGSNFAGVTGMPNGYDLQFDLIGGKIKLVVASSGSFASWISPFGVADPAPAADPDFDGLANAVEYVLGSQPGLSTPTPFTTDAAGENFIVTFSRADGSETSDVTLAVESGTTLGSWPLSFSVGATTATSSEGVTVTENGSDPDTITVTIPKGVEPSRFARIKVTITP